MKTWKTASILDFVSFKASSIICVCIGKEMKPQVRLSTDVYNFTNRIAAFSAQQIKQVPPNTEHKGSACLCGLASHSVCEDLPGYSGIQQSGMNLKNADGNELTDRWACKFSFGAQAKLDRQKQACKSKALLLIWNLERKVTSVEEISLTT